MNKDVAEVSQVYQVAAAEQGVPAGYKQTEVGVIPEDWNAEKMGSLASIQRGASPRPIDSPVWFDRNSPVGWLRISDVSKANKYLTETTQSLSVLGIEHSRFVPKDNLVMSICATVGKPVITKRDLCIHDGFVVFNKLSVQQDYMYYILKELEDEWGKQGQTGSQMNLNTDLINRTYVAIPSLVVEQTAIANALSDVDALLSELEKLIAKKQAIKTATMQQLLTGRTRLPQFALHQDGSSKGYKQSELGEIPEDWEVVPFGSLLSIRHGKSQKDVEVVSGKYPILATGGQIGWANSYLYNKPSVLIGRKGTIDKPRYADTPFWTVDTLFYSEIKSEADAKFIYYKFCMIEWMQYNEASGVPSLNASTIERVLAAAPDKKEQTAIATILSDMDEEIEALEQRLNKTRQIKQGMMQELLTGKTRLVAAQVSE